MQAHQFVEISLSHQGRWVKPTTRTNHLGVVILLRIIVAPMEVYLVQQRKPK